MNLGITFDDVLLTPQYSDIKSRRDIDIGNTLSGSSKHYFKLPVISAPMDTVTEASMARSMDEMGGLGIIHRYNTIEKQVDILKQVKLSNSAHRVGAAIGITGDFLERAVALYHNGVDVLCLDVAHGHHISTKAALEKLCALYKGHVHIMAGNVATLEAFNDLSDWGADSIRVGIGGGSICSTRIQTGHGVPTLQSVIDCSMTDRSAMLIADGGLKTSGDIVKALAAGADFVMLGSLLAGTTEAPGEFLNRPTPSSRGVKVYRGMASEEAQKDWRGKANSLEGISTTIPYKGAVRNVLHKLDKGIRSGFSYSGARNLTELQTKARFIRQTNSSRLESSTHILAN
tara:strand:+ start:13845 stop:14876 length:1032 start_codon:yes stop_codon:yes gene_type:complete